MNATVMADAPPSFSMKLLEGDHVPDWLIRSRIRSLLEDRLREEDKGDPEKQQKHLMDLIARLKASPKKAAISSCARTGARAGI